MLCLCSANCDLVVLEAMQLTRATSFSCQLSDDMPNVIILNKTSNVEYLTSILVD